MSQIPCHQCGSLRYCDTRNEEIGTTDGARVGRHSQLLEACGGGGIEGYDEQRCQ
jgi:hypothetical protein